MNAQPNHIWRSIAGETSSVEVLTHIFFLLQSRLSPTPLPEISAALPPAQLDSLKSQAETLSRTPVENLTLRNVPLAPEGHAHLTPVLQLIGAILEADPAAAVSDFAGTGDILSHLPRDPAGADLPPGIPALPLHPLLPPVATEGEGIRHADTLSEPPPDAEYDIIIGNPPFRKSRSAQPLLDGVKTKSSELLFIIQALQALKPGGQAALIVPCGVLFRKNADLKVRRLLLEQQQLEAVISLPSGVFKPRTGVPTAMLVFSKNAAGTEQTWVYDMQADGFSLDNKRRSLAAGHENNNIPDIIARWRCPAQEQRRDRTEQSFLVPLAEIAGQDYQLRFPLYQEFVPEPVPDMQQILTELKEAEAASREAMQRMMKMMAELGYIPEEKTNDKIVPATGS